MPLFILATLGAHNFAMARARNKPVGKYMPPWMTSLLREEVPWPMTDSASATLCLTNEELVICYRVIRFPQKLKLLGFQRGAYVPRSQSSGNVSIARSICEVRHGGFVNGTTGSEMPRQSLAPNVRA